MGSASCSVFANVTGLPLGWGVFSASLQGKPFRRLLLQSSSLSLRPPVAEEMPRAHFCSLCRLCQGNAHRTPAGSLAQEGLVLHSQYKDASPGPVLQVEGKWY